MKLKDYLDQFLKLFDIRLLQYNNVLYPTKYKFTDDSKEHIDIETTVYIQNRKDYPIIVSNFVLIASRDKNDLNAKRYSYTVANEILESSDLADTQFKCPDPITINPKSNVIFTVNFEKVDADILDSGSQFYARLAHDDPDSGLPGYDVLVNAIPDK